MTGETSESGAEPEADREAGCTLDLRRLAESLAGGVGASRLFRDPRVHVIEGKIEFCAMLWDLNK